MLRSPFSDFKIVSLRGKEFKCHRAVFAAQSIVMKESLRYDLQEEGTSEIYLKHGNNVVAERFVKFFYGEEMKDEKMKENFGHYMELAETWALPDMKQQVEEEAMKQLSQENMVEFYFLAETCQAKRSRKTAPLSKKNHPRQDPNLRLICLRLQSRNLCIGSVFTISQED